MHLVLLPTSLAQHSYSYGMDSEIPDLHLHLHTVFCIGHNLQTIISGEMFGNPTQCHTSVIYDDTGHSVCQQVSLQKISPLKFLIGSCTDLNVDSGSNLKYWLRPRLQPKM